MEASTSTEERPSRSLVPAGLHATAVDVGRLVSFGAAALGSVRGVPRYSAEVLRQLGFLITGTTLLLAFMNILLGFAESTFGLYFLRAAGASDYVGLVAAVLIPRGGVEIMFAFVFAAKVGCSYTAEIGTMRIAEEIDGLEAEGIDPMRYVVATKIAATFLFMPIATAVCILFQNLGNFINSVFVIGEVSAGTFERFAYGTQTFSDAFLAYFQILVIGMSIAIVACFYGYRTSGGPDAVGRSVSRTMLMSLMACFLFQMLFNTLFYGFDPKLPIGG